MCTSNPLHSIGMQIFASLCNRLFKLSQVVIRSLPCLVLLGRGTPLILTLAKPLFPILMEAP